MSEILGRYGEGHAAHVADPARIGYAMKALLPFWGSLRLDAVKGETCRRYARERERAGARSGTVRRELGTLAAAINWCHAEGITLAAPKVTRPERPAPKQRHLTRKEAAHLIRAARRLGRERRYLAHFILIALYTGTRKSAILALRITPSMTSGWVDLERGVIHRRGAAERKTKKVRGTMRMGRKLAALMRRICAHNASHVIEYRGRPITVLSRIWRELQKTAGMPDVSPHTLKHTAITWAIGRGMSKEDAASYFSTSIQTIESTYWHHSPRYQKEAAAIMDRS